MKHSINIIITSFALYILCMVQSSCMAQNKSTDIKNIDGKKFYMHTVVKGQTLYGLSKLYEVDKNDIVLENPAIIDGLKLGGVLKIPANKATTTTTAPTIVKSDNGTHQVQKLQTLYSIAKTYNLSVDELLKLNPSTKEVNIKEGDVLIVKTVQMPTVPKLTVSTTIKPVEIATSNQPQVQFDEVKTIPKNDESITNDNELNIALLLPLFSNSFNDSASLRTKIFSGKSIAALEFYNGFMMGVDSIKKNCISVNLNIFDVENDSLKTLETLSKKEISNANVVIGPFFTTTALLTSEYCAKNNKVYISPVSPNNKVIQANNKAYKTTAAAPTQFEFLANYVTNNAASDRIIAVYYDGAKQKTAISHFTKYCKLKGDSVYTVNYKKQGLKYLTAQLSKTKPNKIIVAITEQALANSFVNALKTLAKTYDIQLLCGDVYLGFENIDYETLQLLKFRAVSNSYIDYNLPNVKKIVEQYHSTYKSEPSKYSMNGYDIACWMAQSIKNNKNLNNLYDTKFIGIADKFIVKSVGGNNGYENYGLYLVGYEDLRLIEDKK
jgi:LysM repeat protein/ABC-type branched-subunit amino acid transport system substrate-binding protein